jgi:hypothetical protein
MPDVMSRRLQATIADEAARRAAATAMSALDGAGRRSDVDISPVLIPGRPDLPKRGRRPHGRSRRWVFSSPLILRSLAAAGVVVVLVGGGILLVNQRSASGPSNTAGSAPRTFNNRSAGIAPIGSVAATRLRYRHGAEYVYTDAVTSGRNYTKADLADGVRREVASAPNVAYPQSTMAPSSAQAGPQHRLSHTTVGQLESCLSTVAASAPGPVVLVEIARYLNLPATIIVFKAVNSAFDVIVVGEACGPAGQDIITKLVVPTK